MSRITNRDNYSPSDLGISKDSCPQNFKIINQTIAAADTGILQCVELPVGTMYYEIKAVDGSSFILVDEESSTEYKVHCGNSQESPLIDPTSSHVIKYKTDSETVIEVLYWYTTN